jgi:hypothetical protein
MSRASQYIWIVLILAASLSLMAGIPTKGVMRPLVRRALVTIALGFAGPLVALLFNSLREHPPRTFHDTVGLFGFLLFALLILPRLLLGRGASTRILEHVIASALYDLLKKFVRVMSVSLLRGVKGLIWLLRRLLQ